MRRRLLLLFALIVSSMMAWADSNGNCGDPSVNGGANVTWSLTGAQLTISGTGAMADYDGSENLAPWKAGNPAITAVIINYGVTTIGNHAFDSCIDLASVTIPASVTTIGEGAFTAASLTSVTIPNSVTTIGAKAFNNCTSLASVTCLATTPPTLGEHTFQFHTEGWALLPNLANIYVLSGYEDAYKGATNWSDYSGKIMAHANAWVSGSCVAVLDGTTLTISGNGAMEDYEGLDEDAPWGTTATSVVVNEGVTSIGAYAFSSCENLTSVTIPSGVTTIGDGAFSYSGLTAVTIPNSVTTIGYSAFNGCTSLASVTIPSSVTAIDALAFKNTSWWDTYKADEKNQYGNIIYINQVAYQAVSQEITSCSFKTGTVSIASHAFDYCDDLSSVTIPNSVTSIGSYAFNNCDCLTSVTIPASVSIIGNRAFYACSRLYTVIFEGSSLSYYGADAYEESALQIILVPNDAAVTAFKSGNWSDQSIHPVVTTLTAYEANGAYWCTYYNSEINRLADENTKVYTVTVSGTTATLHEVDDRIIEKTEGVVLKSTQPTITLTYTENDSETSCYDDINLLDGEDEESECVANTYYTLAAEDTNGDNVKELGFYLYSGTTLAANKAYLEVPAGGARAFLFNLDEESTGIESLTPGPSPKGEGSGYYNLSGQRVSKPKKGLYIVNGKKIFVK